MEGRTEDPFVVGSNIVSGLVKPWMMKGHDSAGSLAFDVNALFSLEKPLRDLLLQNYYAALGKTEVIPGFFASREGIKLSQDGVYEMQYLVSQKPIYRLISGKCAEVRYPEQLLEAFPDFAAALDAHPRLFLGPKNSSGSRSVFNLVAVQHLVSSNADLFSEAAKTNVQQWLTDSRAEWDYVCDQAAQSTDYSQVKIRYGVLSGFDRQSCELFVEYQNQVSKITASQVDELFDYYSEHGFDEAWVKQKLTSYGVKAEDQHLIVDQFKYFHPSIEYFVFDEGAFSRHQELQEELKAASSLMNHKETADLLDVFYGRFPMPSNFDLLRGAFVELRKKVLHLIGL